MTRSIEPDDELLRHIAPSVNAYWQDAVVPALKDYVRIPCISQAYDAKWLERGELESAASFIADWSSTIPVRGLRAEVVRLRERAPLVLIDIDGDRRPESSSLVVYGHYDKQPAGDGWRSGHGPFDAWEEAGRLYGRGVADDGFAVFSGLAAAAALQASGVPHRRLVLVIEGAEESGSAGFPEYMQGLRPSIREPGVIVSLDGGGPTEDRLWEITSLRGAISMNISIAVLEQSVHSGVGGGVVPSAFRILRRLLSQLEDEVTGEIYLDSVQAEIPQHAVAEIETAAAELGGRLVGSFRTLDGIALHGQDDVAQQMMRLTWGPSLAVTGLDGIPPVANAVVVLHAALRLRGLLRIPPTADASEVVDELQRKLVRRSIEGTSGVIPHLEILAAIDGWVADSESSEITRALDRASRSWFGKPSGKIGNGGTCPPVEQLNRMFSASRIGVCGAISPASNAHAPDESLLVQAGAAITGSLCVLLAE